MGGAFQAEGAGAEAHLGKGMAVFEDMHTGVDEAGARIRARLYKVERPYQWPETVSHYTCVSILGPSPRHHKRSASLGSADKWRGLIPPELTHPSSRPPLYPG